MANIKISEMASATTPLGGTELVEIVQGGANKSVSVTNLRGTSTTSASYALNATTSSYALNGGGTGGTTLYTGSTYPITSSWSNTSKTSSYISQPFVKIESGSLQLIDNLGKWWTVNLYNNGADEVTFLIQSGSA